MRHVAAAGLVVMLVIAGCGDDSTGEAETTGFETAPTETTTSVVASTSTTATTEAPSLEEIHIRIARDSMDAWNTGDVDAYLAYFTEDAVLGEWQVHAPHVRDGFEFFMALGNQVTMGDCEQWEDGRIRCDASERDELSGPVGATTEATWSFRIEGDLISKLTAVHYDRSSFEFIRRMTWWLESAYPVVWDSTFAISGQCSDHEEYNCWENWYATAETARILLEFGPEFIAQSEVYSVGG